MTILEKTVLEVIRENYDHIFSAEKKVAHFILNNPEKAVNSNVSELANYSSVSDATVIRFCKHIGYQGYYQLRIILSRDLGRDQSLNSPSRNVALDSVSALFQSYASDMLEICKGLSPNKILDCVSLIKNCDHAHIIAAGNTSPLAQYMGFRLGRLGVRCTHNMLPEYFLNHINLASEHDIVIAISQSGTSKQVVQAMELAREKNLKIIAITGYEFSPVSKLADYVLLSGVKESSFDYYKSYSHLNETAVVDALLHFVTNEEKIVSSKADKPEIILSEYKF